MVGEREAKQWL